MPVLPAWCQKSSLGHGLLDEQGTCICLNPAILDILQRPIGEFLGRRFYEIIEPSSREVFHKAWEEVVSGTFPSRCMDLEFLAPDGGRVFTDVFLTKFSETPSVMMLQMMNFTRHKETEIALAKAKGRLHLTAAVAGMGYWEYDFKTKIQHWDDEVFRIYGIRREDFSGRWDTYVHPEDIATAEQVVFDVLKNGESGEQRFRTLRPDGSIRHLHSIFTIERDADGEPVLMTGINFDITDSVVAKETEERNEASLRLILDNLPIPVTTSRTSGNGEMTLINKEFTRLLGYTIDDAPTITKLVELNFPDAEVRAQGMSWWRDLIAQSKENPTPARNVPFHVMSKAGTFRNLLANATVVDDTLILASHDISDLLESRKSLERILENLPVPALVMDLTVPFEERGLLLMNRKITEIYGYTREDTPTAMQWVDTVFPDLNYRKMVFEWWNEAIKQASLGSGVIDEIEFQLVAKDGTCRDVHHNGYLSGTQLVLTLQDVTAQKHAAANLEASYKYESILRAQAEHAAKAKVRFLAGVSHEIRTPISALVNISQAMLLESDKYSLPAEFLEHLETVRSGGQYLNLILTNLLDVSSAESGHAPVRATTFYLRDWVEDIGAILEPIARSMSVQIVWSLPDDDNETFTTDPVRLSQILLNLAHNAVKFSVKPGARVWISVSTGLEACLRLSVADEGPGIPPEKLEGLYREFGQSDTGTKSSDRGVGLGLAVVRQNIDLLGGRMSTRVLSPSGICFEIELPGLKISPDNAHSDCR
jgi:PAS domain S-box-containing protein